MRHVVEQQVHILFPHSPRETCRRGCTGREGLDLVWPAQTGRGTILLCPQEPCVVLVLTCSTENGFGLECSNNNPCPPKNKRAGISCTVLAPSHTLLLLPSRRYLIRLEMLNCFVSSRACGVKTKNCRRRIDKNHISQHPPSCHSCCRYPDAAAGICILLASCSGPSLLRTYLVVVSLIDNPYPWNVQDKRRVFNVISTDQLPYYHVFPGFFPLYRSRLIVWLRARDRTRALPPSRSSLPDISLPLILCNCTSLSTLMWASAGRRVSIHPVSHEASYMDTMVYRGGCELDLDPDDSDMENCVPSHFPGLLVVVCRLIVEADVIFAQIRAIWRGLV